MCLGIITIYQHVQTPVQGRRQNDNLWPRYDKTK